MLELGWRDDLLGQFDATISFQGREGHKPERIGKKYQWIAYDELHARISDNYGLADTNTCVMDSADWERGLWPSNHRDIDPSMLLRSTPRDAWGANHSNWWTPHSYTSWRSKPTPDKWLKSSADVPPIVDFIQLRDVNGERWLLLDGFHLWRHKVEAEGSWRPTRDRQELHLIFRSYITKANTLPAVLRAGAKSRTGSMIACLPQNTTFTSTSSSITGVRTSIIRWTKNGSQKSGRTTTCPRQL